ncbi:ABC transporter permease [Henriciella mobilis]|nr:ABC transporter permease [Henriciella mobilis]
MSYRNYLIAPPKAFNPPRYVQELLRYRHLSVNLMASDIRSRFRRSRLGVLWAIIQPMVYAMVIAWVWGSIFQMDGYWEFAIYLYSGLIIWDYFSTVTMVSMDALVNAGGYLKQSRIPFFIFQLRVPMTAAFISLLGIVGLLVLKTLVDPPVPLTVNLLLMPLYYVILLAFGLPVAIIMSLLGAQFRDVQHITGLAVQGLFFLTPVMITRDILDKPELQILNYINPVTPLIHMFRDPMIYGKAWNPEEVLTMGIWIVVLWVLAVVLSLGFGRKPIYLV